jgi:hypothetical protein
VLEHIEHTVLERAMGRLRDDVALLAVRLDHGDCVPASTPPPGDGEPHEAPDQTTKARRHTQALR